ncbi:SPBc2 prophage-derived glycosyltransferase SunS [Anatilimnocola aggregata]|uniref:SPBc2 prophage-derived glycosyltransferase SunS n=1 Tax=Anatilimnocola aggregata TaxID=2528021 RepID=A0A517Y9F0_9BACT|nr:TPR domain-containing glycosyltransferase [Anatilimnocola aggregata]QDU26821.1 SPBc2 prophage-derived glycosyltransferase SunS [Anatilimnocola aggregata]
MNLRPRVSLCMIVRNEEANLRSCLQPVQHLFDEVIVVDTGSADGTREIAETLGAKVFDYEWSDDFSSARNFAADQATGDWIFWLDADDRIDEQNRVQLAELMDKLATQPTNAPRRFYVMTTVSSSRHSTEPTTLISHTRLFRNHPQARWTGRVHEQITPQLETLGDELVHTDLRVEHLGYVDPALCQRKANRDLRLLRMDYATDPENPVTSFLLGTTYLRTGQANQALAHLLKSLQLVKSRGDWVRRLYALIVETLVRLGRREEAFGFTTEALQSFPHDVELVTRRAELLCDFNDLGGAEQCLRDLFNSPRSKHLLHGASTYHDGREGRILLGRIYRETQRFDAAEQVFQELLAENPAWIPAWVNLGYAYLMQHRWGDIEYVARQLEKCEMGDPYAQVLRAEAKVARGDLKEARQLVEKAISRAPQLAWARIVLSDILLRDGTDREACIAVQRDILRLNPGNPQALRNLEVLTQPPAAQPAPTWPLGWSITVNP